jgi:hypothetical protein
MTRFVVHPRNINVTPKRIWKALGAQGKKYPNLVVDTWDFEKDFFMVYPKPSEVKSAPVDVYNNLYNFWQATKYSQRRRLETEGVPIIPCAVSYDMAKKLKGSKFVVRPFRHTGGMEYRVVQSPLSFMEGSEYISEFFFKTKEYRIIYVYGKPLVYLRKIVPKELSQDEPWNYANGSHFNTVDAGNSLLKHTDCMGRLTKSETLRHSHIVGVDVLMDAKNNYAVCEFNACPALSIETNLEKIVAAIKQGA